MPKSFSFSHIALRDFLLTVGLPIAVVVLVGWVAYRLIDPFPPAHVTLSTGQENSAYEEFGKRYAKELAKHHIVVTLKPSLGSSENLQRLRNPDSDIDIAFVQSGSTELSDATRDGLISLGSLFTEPVWLFYRDKHHIARLNQLKGLKINVGPEGSGVPALFRKLLDVNDVDPSELRLSALENTPATVELLGGRIDGLVFSSAPDAPLVQMLLQTPGIRLYDFTQSEAYTHRLPFLSAVILPRGIVDLGKNIPSKDYHLIAPTATLVARENLHPALQDLFVQAAAQIHGGAGWFHRQGDFPNAHYTEVPVAPEAEKFYKSGPPLLQHFMPFWIANFIERMWVALVAIGALVLPLSKIVPPLYIWKVRSRIYRWYGQLRLAEYAVEGADPERKEEVRKDQLQRLDGIEERVNQISIPLSFAEELYELRRHIDFVRRRIRGRSTGEVD
jgi:TRAP-type uncharacterized transport system substrate-binding protein